MAPDNPSIALRFHGLACVLLVRPTDALERQCRALFGRFEVEPTAAFRPEIRVERLDGDARRGAAVDGRKNADPFVVVERNGQPLVLHGYGQSADVMAAPGDPITLHYRPDGRGSQKVIGRLFVYLQMALRRKGALLFKGAVLAQEGRCVLITGFSGGGKTSLVLQLLASGWSFLSDDTCILAGGVAHIFRPFIVVNQYHLERLGAGHAAEGWPPKAVRYARVRHVVRRVVIARAPRALERSQKLQRLCDPRLRLDPRSLHPGCEVLETARPTDLWVVRPGERTGVRPIPLDDALRRVESIQRLTYDEFERVRQNLAVFSGAWCTPPLDALIRANVVGVRAFEVTRSAQDGDGALAALLAAAGGSARP